MIVLLSAMEHYQGIGLSANQIGIKERAFIMYSDIKKERDNHLF
jgi:peptide deformylase